VLRSTPAFWNPLLDASEIEVTGPDEGRVALAGGYGSHDRRVHMVRGSGSAAQEFWPAGTRHVPKAALRAEMRTLRRGAEPPGGGEVVPGFRTGG
jgi:hypothetical protein